MKQKHKTPGCHVPMTESVPNCHLNTFGTAGGGVMLLTPTDTPIMPFRVILGTAAMVIPKIQQTMPFHTCQEENFSCHF